MINKIARILTLTAVMGTALLSYSLPLSHKATTSYSGLPALIPQSGPTK